MFHKFFLFFVQEWKSTPRRSGGSLLPAPPLPSRHSPLHLPTGGTPAPAPSPHCVPPPEFVHLHLQLQLLLLPLIYLNCPASPRECEEGGGGQLQAGGLNSVVLLWRSGLDWGSVGIASSWCRVCTGLFESSTSCRFVFHIL